MTSAELNILALYYLQNNPYRFNRQEKDKFLKGLQNWLNGKTNEIDDEVYDFLLDIGIYKQERREDEFISFINQKYGIIRFSRILDVGAGRMCKLSQALARYGNTMYAIDPNIRLLPDEVRKMGIKSIKKELFICDEFAKNGIGTNVRNIDYIFGVEPCDATEHIIRQGLKYDKPFDILLCAAPHKSLDGKIFESYEKWYEYLNSISSEVQIKKFKTSYYASNDKRNDNRLDIVEFEK